jgi:hypothetical protein
MKAGLTDLEVGTTVRLAYVHDKEDVDLSGIEGTITHPFPGLMGPGDRSVAGLYVSSETAAAYGLLIERGQREVAINIDERDVVEAVDADFAEDLVSTHSP